MATRLGGNAPWEQTRTIGINGTWPVNITVDNNTTNAYKQALTAVNPPNVQTQDVVRLTEPFVKGVRFPSLPPVRYPDLQSVPGTLTPPVNEMREAMVDSHLDAQDKDEPVPMDVDKDTVPGPGPRPFPIYGNQLMSNEEMIKKVFGPTVAMFAGHQWGMGPSDQV